jgi:hypothetical protein
MPQVLPALALGLLALRVVRLEGFFALAAVLLLAPRFAGLGPERLPLSRKPTSAEAAAVGALCLAGLLAAGVAAARGAGCITMTNPALTTIWAPEAEAVAFIQRNALEGRLLTWFDYGEMAIWHFAPRLRVSYDGRRETVYSERIRNAHDRFYSGADGGALARETGADFAWLPVRLPAVEALEGGGWHAIFRGPTSVVLGREPRAYTQPERWSGPRCFPGP